MRSNFLGPNVAFIEAVHFTTKQVLFMVLRGHIGMLNERLVRACSAMTFLDSTQETLISF